MSSSIRSQRPSQKFARNAFFLLAGQFGAMVLAFILTAVLGRWLGAADYGVYYLLATISSFAYVFVDWGQSAYLVREAARRREDNGRLLGSALAFRVVAACVIALITAILAKAFADHSGFQFLSLLSVLCALPLALSQTYGYMLRGNDRMDLDAIISVAGKAFTVLLSVPAIMLGGSLIALFSMQAVAGIGALLVAAFLARKMLLQAQYPEGGTIKELLKGGAPIAAFFLSIAVQPFLDAIVLSAIVPPAVVGWYGAARTIIGVLYLPASILSSAAFPELSRVSGSVGDMRRVLGATLRLMLVLSGVGALGTFQFADLVVTLLYGRGQFDPAAAVLQIFAPLLPLLFMDTLFGAALIAAGKTKEIAIVKAISVAVSTVLAVVLVPVSQTRWGNGGIGLVLAFGSAEMLMLNAYLLLLPKGVLDRKNLLDFFRTIAAGSATIMLFLALPAMPSLAALPASIGIFVVIAFATGLLFKTDIDTVRGLFRTKKI